MRPLVGVAVPKLVFTSVFLWNRYSSKALALFAGIWLIVNWVLTCVLLLTPNTLDKAFYYGVRHAAVIQVAPMLSLKCSIVVDVLHGPCATSHHL